MDGFLDCCREFWKNDEGLTVVEYVLGAGLLVIALVGIFAGMNDLLAGKLNNIVSSINTSG